MKNLRLRIISALTVSLLVCLSACSNEGEPETANDGAETAEANGAVDGPAPNVSARTRGRTVTWDYAYMDEDTGRIHVSFLGGQSGEIETNPCAAEYELNVKESADHFEITVYELLPENTNLWPDSVNCDDIGYSRELDGPANAPLDGRAAFGGSSELASMQDVLVPTALPASWEWIIATGRPPGYLFAYGPPEAIADAPRDRAPLTMWFEPIHSGVPLVDEVRSLDGAQRVDLGPREGWIGTRGSGRVVLAFEDQNWNYQILGGFGVDRELIEAFARKFVRYRDRSSATFSPGLRAPVLDSTWGESDNPLAWFSSGGESVSPTAQLDGDVRRARNNVPWSSAITAGPRITVTFDGGAKGDHTSACNWDHRLVVDENDERVVLRVESLRLLADGADFGDCGASNAAWALSAALNEPLGDRELIDSSTGITHLGVQLETRLVPAALPNGWVALTEDLTLPQQSATFGASGDTKQAHILVLTNPITASPRLAELRRSSGFQTTTIRMADDGVVVTEDERTTVGFEEQGWYYRVIATPDVDLVTVLEFARSFERPARIEAGTRGSDFTRWLVVAEPQAGQS